MDQLQGESRQPLAVISCIHGNLPALEAVIADIAQSGVKHVACLGDLVGYGPQPNEVIEYLAEHSIRSIMGCWDESMVMEKSDCGCVFNNEDESELGVLAHAWTSDRLSLDSLDYLRDLPQSIRAKNAHGQMLFVHGSPRSKTQYMTLDQPEVLHYTLAAEAGVDVLFCGHTHVPFVKNLACTVEVETETLSDSGRIETRRFKPKLIINAGSVGEPRHGGHEATYVVYDPVGMKASIRKVAYDWTRTVAAMRERDVPDIFIQRFCAGQEITGKNKSVTCAC